MTGLEPQNVTNEQQGTYEKGQKERVHNRVQNPEKVPDFEAKWDSLSEIEKQLIMKLLK